MEEGDDGLLLLLGPVAELGNAGLRFPMGQYVAHDADQEQSSARHTEQYSQHRPHLWYRINLRNTMYMYMYCL